MMPSALRRALLVIDVQNEYVTGNLPIEYPHVHESLGNITRAMDAADAHGIPVIVVPNTAPKGSPVFAKGTTGWDLHEIVNSRERSHYIEKILPDAFSGTDLSDWLVEHGVNVITIVGYMTHNCDDATVKHALHAGYAVEFLTDASGSLSYENSAGTASAEEIHRVFSVVMHTRFAAVACTDEWIAALRTGAALSRDNIFASNQRARDLEGARHV